MTEKLTDLKLKSLKPKAKPYNVFGGTISGLCVTVSPTGKRVFRLRFRFEGKEQLLTIGSYSEWSLQEAREIAMEARKNLAHGIDPKELKKQKLLKAQANDTTFRFMTEQWLIMRQTVKALLMER